MSHEAFLRRSSVSVEVNDSFTEAVLVMTDRSRLRFCHRVGERWAKAEGAGGPDGQAGLAREALSMVVLFRLNGKHLDIQFQDGSRWEVRFRGSTKGQ